ncbi:MAG: CDP-glycerol glycerophosphotransferase family protein [Eubacterium sp.]
MKKSILKICFKPLSFINKLIKKDNSLIFFYSNLGFRDNVRAFYEYLIENNYNDKFKIAVSINDYEDYEKNAPANVTFMSNRKGIKTFMKAKYAFYCFGKYPIKPAKNQMVVNLWHGTPLKKIGNLEKGLENIDYNFFTSVITTSPMYKPIMAKIFGCSERNVKVFGNPRNDEMFKENRLIDDYIRGKNSKVIVWLPTYREYDDDFTVSVLNENHMQQLNNFLEKNNCKLIIKLHPLQKADAHSINHTNIEFVTQKQLSDTNSTVYTLLRNADGLITDYSSVYFDYMLLDRPIAFAVEDIEQYKARRGFIFDNPKEYMPGMEVRDLNDIKNFITSIVTNKDAYKEQRHRVNERINYYKDGNNCKRIAEYFIK